MLEDIGADCVISRDLVRVVSLGSRILRAETAAIALMAVASYELGN